MSAIKNVTVIGASGQLGTPLIKALLESGKFNVSIVTRIGSTSSFPSSLKVTQVDYSSLETLTAAFQGQDAVISVVPPQSYGAQKLFFDAAIAADVQRFLPSEFGHEVRHANASTLPVFQGKIDVRNHIEKKVKLGVNTSYTYMITGSWLDWSIQVGFLLPWQEGKDTRIFDEGTQAFTGTTLPTICDAVVGVLSHPEQTKNRSVYIGEFAVSQNQLLEIAKKVAPKKKWNLIPTSTYVVEKAADAELAKGNFSVLYEYVFVAFCRAGYGGEFEPVDNQLLGVTTKTEGSLEAIWKETLFGR